MDDTVTRRIPWGPEAPLAPMRPSAPERLEPAIADPLGDDPVLNACLDGAFDGTSEEDARALATYFASQDAGEIARLANAHPPTLVRSDVEAERIARLDIHPAYHALMNRSVGAGLTSSAWEDAPSRDQHRLRAAGVVLAARCERGHLIAASETHAAVAALAYASEVEAELFPLIASRCYDRRPLPLEQKEGATLALALDATTTVRAEFARGDRCELRGRCRMTYGAAADGILLVAETKSGPTAAIVPRYAVEGAARIDDLSHPLGFASQACGSLAVDGAQARTIGERGRGHAVVRDVRTLTQLDAVLIAAGALRTAVASAIAHARARSAGGRLPIEDPLASRVLADLALQSAASTALGLRLAGAFDLAFESDAAHALARLVVPAARIAIVKSAPMFALEAAEMIGRHALLPQNPVARACADLHALGAWQGEASLAAADLTQLVARDESVLHDALQELGTDLGKQHRDLVEDVARLGVQAAREPSLGRRFAERLAMLAAAASMRRVLPRVVPDAYIATRLRERHRVVPGGLDGAFDALAIIDFIVPQD